MAGMREPRWYHERWAILMLLVLVPPIGILCAITTPNLRQIVRVLGSLAFMFCLVVAGVVEQDDALLTRIWLDGSAAIQYRRGRSRFGTHEHGLRIQAFRRAFQLEPPPGVGNILNTNPESSQAAYRLGRSLLGAGDLPGARVALSAASIPGPRLSEGPGGYTTSASAKKDIASSFGAAQVSLAVVELDLGFADRAQSRLSAILDGNHISPAYPLVTLLRGRLQTRREPEEARKTLMELVWKRNFPFLADTHRQLAVVAEGAGDMKLALFHQLCRLRVESGDEAGLRDAGAMARELGLSAVPVQAFARAVQLQIHDRAAEISAPIYGKILERYPDFAGVAMCHLMLGAHRDQDLRDRHAAVESYRSARDAARHGAVKIEASYKLGRVLGRLGLKKAARNAFQVVLDEAPAGAYYLGAARRGMRRLDRPNETRKKIEEMEDWYNELSSGKDGE